MNDVLQAAENSGMTQEQGETAAGGVMNFLKAKLGDDNFKKIETQFPGIGEAGEKYTRSIDANAGGFGGLLGSAMSSFSGVGGSAEGGAGAGGLATLTAMLASKGINPSMVQKFLSQIAPIIQQKCGIDVTKYLGGTTPSTAGTGTTETASTTTAGTATTEGAAGASTGGEGSAEINNLMGQAMGMFGK
jgi:hypothetical protein